MSLAQQGHYRVPLIQEETDITLRCSEYECPFQRGQCTGSIPLCCQSQRTHDEDFQDTTQACFGLGIPDQPFQEAQNILEKRAGPAVAGTSRIVMRLRDAHPCQGQVLSLTGIAQILIPGRQPTGVSPVDSCRYVVLSQFELRP